MHSTRRSPERARSAQLAVFASSVAAALALAASCSDATSRNLDDPAPDTGVSLPPPASSDAGPSSDASAPFIPPPPFRVTCTEKPCAVGLSADSVMGASFCALLDDGHVACWGTNVGGVLGRSAPDGGPVIGIGLPDFVEGVSGAVAIESTCVLRADGTVQCWGPGARQLPFTGVLKLSKGYTNRCAVVGSARWSCVDDVDAGSGGGPSGPYPERMFDAPPGSPLRQIYVGNAVDQLPQPADATFLLREDGALLSSGARNFIGRETSLYPVDPYFGEIGLRDVTDFDVGDCACAIAGGNVYCWGSRKATTYPEDALPLRITLPEPAVLVSAVGFPRDVAPPEPAFRRLCAIGASGVVYCAGPNSSGQVGDGTRIARYVPVPVKELPEPAVDVVATRSATCALVETGKVYCWGSGTTGALGNGFSKDELTPISVTLP